MSKTAPGPVRGLLVASVLAGVLSGGCLSWSRSLQRGGFTPVTTPLPPAETLPLSTGGPLVDDEDQPSGPVRGFRAQGAAPRAEQATLIPGQPSRPVQNAQAAAKPASTLVRKVGLIEPPIPTISSSGTEDRPTSRDATAPRPGSTPTNRASDQKLVAEVEELPLPSDSLGRPARPDASPVGGWTFDQVVNATLLNDPVLRSGFEAIRQAQGDSVTSSLKPNPELEIAQTLLPLTSPFIADIREGGPPQLDVMLSYPIDWYIFGKRAAAMQVAARGVRVSQAEYADLVRQRVLESALAYYDILEQEALVALAVQDVENLRQIEDGTLVAVDAGARPAVEISRVRLDRLASEQILRETQRDLEIARAELRALIGGGDSGPGFRLAGTLEITDAPPAPPLESAIAIAENNRPDLQAIQWTISANQMNVELARREGFPEMAPMIGYTRQFQERAIGQPDADSWGIGLNMTLPVHDRNQGNRLRAASELAQARYDLQAARLELRAEMTSVLAELEAARQNATALAEEQRQLAAEVRDSLQAAYEAGGRPLLDVLDAQRNYRETVRNAITSRADYWRAVHRFQAALGTTVGTP